MRRFLLALAVYAVALYGIGTWVSPAEAKIRWVWCAPSKPKLGISYAHIVRPQGWVHTRLKCYSPGLWIRVNVPWSVQGIGNCAIDPCRVIK